MYKIVIADDEEFVLESFNASVNWEAYGFQVVGLAYNGVDAYELIQALKPDVVFTDIKMPGLNGLEVIKRTLDLDESIQCIVISGHAEFAYAQRALNYGAIGYCLKPFEDSEIISMLNKAKSILDKDIGREGSELPDTKDDLDLGSIGNEENIKNETLRPVMHYIDKNYLGEISLNSVGELFSINPTYLSYLFKKENGETFTNYIIRLRMEYACDLLTSTQLNVTEISKKVGYDDYYYFAKLFKRIIGSTATEYRINRS